MKRLDHRPADVPGRVYVIAYDKHRYTITVGGKLVGSVAFDTEGKAGVGEDAVLVLARHHADCLATSHRSGLRIDFFRAHRLLQRQRVDRLLARFQWRRGESGVA